MGERAKDARRRVLSFLSGAAYTMFIAGSMAWFVCDVIDAALSKDATRLAEDIVLFLAGLITAAVFDVLEEDGKHG
jgi:hypothetical protein